MTSRCRNFAQKSQLYVPVYTPLVCPDPVNTDPKRNEAYCKPNHVRSEPLSHGEYLRQLVANNGVSISSGPLTQYGTDIYKRTDWMASRGSCILPNVSVPKVSSEGASKTYALQASSGRGTISKYDSVNRTEDLTAMRRAGLAISSSGGCANCTISGTSANPPTGGCQLCS
jgi:hypothetical protein